MAGGAGTGGPACHLECGHQSRRQGTGSRGPGTPARGGRGEGRELRPHLRWRPRPGDAAPSRHLRSGGFCVLLAAAGTESQLEAWRGACCSSAAPQRFPGARLLLPPLLKGPFRCGPPFSPLGLSGGGVGRESPRHDRRPAGCRAARPRRRRPARLPPPASPFLSSAFSPSLSASPRTGRANRSHSSCSQGDGIRPALCSEMPPTRQVPRTKVYNGRYVFVYVVAALAISAVREKRVLRLEIQLRRITILFLPGRGWSAEEGREYFFLNTCIILGGE